MGKYDQFRGKIPTFKEALADLKAKYSDFEQKQLLEKFSELKEKKKNLDQQLKDVDRELIAVMEVLVEQFEAEDITQVKSGTLGTFSRRTKVYVNQKDKEKLKRWLRENNYGDIIKEQVNPQVLNALMTDILSSGSLPEDAGIEVFLKESIANTQTKT